MQSSIPALARMLAASSKVITSGHLLRLIEGAKDIFRESGGGGEDKARAAKFQSAWPKALPTPAAQMWSWTSSGVCMPFSGSSAPRPRPCRRTKVRACRHHLSAPTAPPPSPASSSHTFLGKGRAWNSQSEELSSEPPSCWKALEPKGPRRLLCPWLTLPATVTEHFGDLQPSFLTSFPISK